MMRPLIDARASLSDAVRTLLAEIGEDPDREGLTGTPERVRRMYDELTAGYHVDPDALINGACFTVDYDEMVVVRDIEFFSLCEHHLLPFIDRKSTRLNSSHLVISYAVFCLKKKKKRNR